VTTVINIRAIHDVPYVYIGRGSKWGNPYTHLDSRYVGTVKVSTREEAVESYERYVKSRPDLMEAARKELRGKVLGCFCKPKACHGDVLARIAEEEIDGHDQ
jgi:hypothetical protein